MAQFNVANQSFYTSNKSIAEVVMIANSSGSIINSFSNTGTSSALVESLWTDDSNNYYVRIDNGTSITWSTPMGVPTTAPLTAVGIRPAAGVSIILDTSRYQATALRMSDININDYLSHVVTADPATGSIIANFWLNVTQNTKLTTPPSSANITPISPLPANAAQETGGNLANIYTKLSSTIGISAQANVVNWPATSNVNLYINGAVASVSNPAPVKLTDGANVPAVKASGAAALSTDPALVVAISPNSVNPNGQKTSALSAPVVIASDQSAISISGNVNAQANVVNWPSTSNVNLYISGAVANTTNPVPVSGNVNAQANVVNWPSTSNVNLYISGAVANTTNPVPTSETYTHMGVNLSNGTPGLPFSVGQSVVLLAGIRAGRKEVQIILENNIAIRINNTSSGVSGTSGALIGGAAGYGDTVSGGDAVYGYAPSGTAIVSIIEVY